MMYCSKDAKGRFAPKMDTEPLKLYNIIDIKLEVLEKNIRKKARLLYYESQLLYLLVDNFNKLTIKN